MSLLHLVKGVSLYLVSFDNGCLTRDVSEVCNRSGIFFLIILSFIQMCNKK